MINVNWLRTFCSLVEVGHFTRTAERLHMTQSGVSQHVRKLEEQLQVELLVRHGKDFSLTEAGNKLYQQGAEVLLTLSNLRQDVVQDSPFEGLVRIMSPGSVGLKLYPKLTALQKAHPKLTIDYRFAPNQDVEHAIAVADVDIGLMTTPSSMVEVSTQAIAKEPLLLVTPADVSKASWSQLNALGFINHPDASHHASLLLSANYPEFQHIEQFKSSGFSNQISLILEPVSQGLGFTVLPAYAVEAFVAQNKIRAHALANPVTETLYLGLPSRLSQQQRVLTVIDKIKVWLESEA